MQSRVRALAQLILEERCGTLWKSHDCKCFYEILRSLYVICFLGYTDLWRIMMLFVGSLVAGLGPSLLRVQHFKLKQIQTMQKLLNFTMR